MKPPFRTVLCPTDLSPVGNLAVGVACRLAAEGGDVHLLHVAEPPGQGNPLYAQYVQGWVPTPADRAGGEEKAKRMLSELHPKEAGARSVRTHALVVQSKDVVDAILKAAKDVRADVIVMGTRGRTGVARMFLGSVANEVLKRDARLVLVHHDDVK